jgi:hypothetical protein
MEWAFLNPSVHPFYLHARREVFLAYRGNRPVGRIAAIVDDLHNEHYQDRLGFFGFFESPPEQEVADRLLTAAASGHERKHRRRCQTGTNCRTLPTTGRTADFD